MPRKMMDTPPIGRIVKVNKKYADWSEAERARSFWVIEENGEAKGYWVRKFTGREYWRLMGFTDAQHDIAAAVNSEGQLYKQAGNSIVVDSLVALLKPNFGEPRQVRIGELFGGIGAPRAALERMGFQVASQYVEMEPKAVKSYNALYGANETPKDIKTFNDLEPDLDLLVQGSPCTDFSPMGQGEGGEKGSGTASSLIWHVIEVIAALPAERRPKVVLGENVKGILFEKHKPVYDGYVAELSKLGYRSFTCVMNAKDYGIPQSRTRVFTYSVLDPDFKFTEPTKVLMKPLTEIVQKNVEERYYYSEEFMRPRADKGRTDWVNVDLNTDGEIVVVSERQRGTAPELPHRTEEEKTVVDGTLFDMNIQLDEVAGV